jgi:hypothetical protein
MRWGVGLLIIVSFVTYFWIGGREHMAIEKSIVDSKSMHVNDLDINNPKREVAQVEENRVETENRIKVENEAESDEKREIILAPVNGFGEYKLVENLFAVRRTAETEAIFDLKDYKLGHYIVADAKGFDAKAVVVSESGRLGIFTGVLRLKLKSMDDLESLFVAYKYSVEERLDYIQSALLKFENYDEAVKAYEMSLKSDKVRRCSLEVLDVERRAK